MKYLSIPVHLVKFWYLESLIFFLRTWKNLILYLEEDLAVGLMLRLLFVPLFHDKSIVGLILSFLFRLSRIFIGLFAFSALTVFILFLALVWFLLPVLMFTTLNIPSVIFQALCFSGVVLFVYHIVSHPPKRVWQVKPENVDKCSFIRSSELDYLKLLKNLRVKKLLSYLEITPQDLANLQPQVTKEELNEKAWELGKSIKVPYLQPEHFFVSFIFHTPDIDQKLAQFNLKVEDFINALDFWQKKNEVWRIVFPWDEDFRVRHLRGVNRGWLGVPTPNLDRVCDDLTKMAGREEVADFVGRQDVVSQVINTLSLEKGRNVLIVGEPGSGRDALVRYLAKLIISGDAPSSLATKRLVRLDITRLLAGISSQGDLAQRVKDIFEEVEYSGNIIVYVEDIQNLGIGEASSEFNLYALLTPYIDSSLFQFVAVTDPGSYTRVLEKNGNFARIFAKVDLPPAGVSDTITILKNQAIKVERFKKISITLPAINELAQISSRYIHQSVLPESALQTFQECLVVAKDGWVNKKIVDVLMQQRTNIPVAETTVETKKQLLNLEGLIHQKMIDQEEAVAVVADTLRRAAAGLREENRPIGSFLFVGPTGVGKTELAKILVEEYFEGKGLFLRLDMSEYQNTESLGRLIGKPGEEGLLTENIFQHPYSLVLLDEFEKADPKILNLFLQVLDDGRLTSGSGKTVDFSNTIIIATSNAASLTIAKGLQNGKTIKDLNKEVKDELMQIFKPELVNRFDEMVLFKPLSPQDLQKVVELKLADLKDQLKEKGYLVEFAPELLQKLAEKGYDPVLGARPLRRLIQDTLEAKLSTLILENKLVKGEKFMADVHLLA